MAETTYQVVTVDVERGNVEDKVWRRSLKYKLISGRPRPGRFLSSRTKRIESFQKKIKNKKLIPVPTSRDAPRDGTNHRYFEFKRL